MKQAEAITRDWVRADTPRDITPPEPTPQTHIEQTDKFNRAHLCWAMPGYSEQDPKSRVADLAAYALGASRGSRLFWALKEPGIADSVGFDHSSKDGAGAFFGYASCDPKRTQEVADLLRATVREACGNGLTEAEVNGARRKMAAGRTLSAETPLGRLMPVGGDWLYLDWVRLENVLPSTYTGGWHAFPEAIGLRGANEALVYLVSPEVSYPGGATNSIPPAQQGQTVGLTNWPGGRFVAE